MSNSTSNLDLIKNAYAAFASGDVSAVLGIMDPEIEWHEPEGFVYPGTFRGPDGVLTNLFMKLATEWDGWSAEPDEFVAGDRVVAVFGHYTGTFSETGKSMRSPFSHYWRIVGGKVVEFRTYMDTVLVKEALI